MNGTHYSYNGAFVRCLCVNVLLMSSFMLVHNVVHLLTGNNTRYDLTPVTAVSVHLLRSDGTPVSVNGPICVTVPLPTTNSLKHNTHVPAWRFDQKFGKQHFDLDPKKCVHRLSIHSFWLENGQGMTRVMFFTTVRRVIHDGYLRHVNSPLHFFCVVITAPWT